MFKSNTFEVTPQFFFLPLDATFIWALLKSVQRHEKWDKYP